MRRWIAIYNRYVPGANGGYQRQTVEDQKRRVPPLQEQPVHTECRQEEMTCASEKTQPNEMGRRCQPAKWDLGDLLLLCIVLLLLIDSDEDDMLSVLVTAAAFLFL